MLLFTGISCLDRIDRRLGDCQSLSPDPAPQKKKDLGGFILLRQFSFDRAAEAFGRCAAGIATHDFTLFVDQELLKVPFHITSRSRFGQFSIERVFVAAQGFDFIKQLEANAILGFAEGRNFVIAVRFLCAKVVAGKGHHFQSLSRILLVERFETAVLLGVAAVGGHVHHQQDLPGIVRQLLIGTRNSFDGDVRNISHDGGLNSAPLVYDRG